MSKGSEDWKQEEPLPPVKCLEPNCKKNRHVFRRKRYGDESCRSEKCIYCGAERVDWDRVGRMDLLDADFTIQMLNFENVRYYYWHTSIDSKAVNHARRLGLEALRSWTAKRLDNSIGEPSSMLFRDGMQTPKCGRIVYYAQHAMACCCRKCADEWYGIERERSLKTTEVDYLTGLAMLYVRTRLPRLTLQGERIPHS